MSNSIVIYLTIKKVAQGFVDHPFKIPKQITAKQFYAIYSCLSEMYKGASSPRNSASSLTFKNNSRISLLEPSSDEITGSPMRLKSTAIDDEIDDDRECKICMENSIEVILKCNHVFCQKCFDDWQVKNDTCAMCRQPLMDSSSVIECPPVASSSSPSSSSLSLEENKIALDIRTSNIKLPSGLIINPSEIIDDEITKRQITILQNLRMYVMHLGKITLYVKPPPRVVEPTSPIRNAIVQNNRRQSSRRSSSTSSRHQMQRYQAQRLEEAARVPWTCGACTFEGNPGNLTRCQVCNTSRHTAILQALLADLQILEARRISEMTARQRGGTTSGSDGGATTTSSTETIVGSGTREVGEEMTNTNEGVAQRWNDLDLQLALFLSMQGEE